MPISLKVSKTAKKRIRKEVLETYLSWFRYHEETGDIPSLEWMKKNSIDTLRNAGLPSGKTTSCINKFLREMAAKKNQPTP